MKNVLSLDKSSRMDTFHNLQEQPGFVKTFYMKNWKMTHLAILIL